MTVAISTVATQIFSGAGCLTQKLADGGFIIRSNIAERSHPAGVFEALQAYASADGKRTLFRESDFDSITAEITVGEAYRLAHDVGKALLTLGASAERPVALIAENSIRLAVIILGCYAARVPVAPISPSYSKLSGDFSKLRYVLGELTPAVVVFDDGEAHARALAALSWSDTKVVVMDRGPRGTLSWEELLVVGGSSALPEGGNPDEVAKILFTSGSTGNPKGVINTQRMMMSNQIALAQVWPGIFDRPPCLVCWLPWNHTYGGNQIFNMPIVFGGTLTIDRGRPTPDGIGTMEQSIRRTRPSVLLSVPRALDMIATRLEQDVSFAEATFENLDLIGYAGAALPTPVAYRLQQIGRRVTGRNIPVVGLWGSTETAPVATAVYFSSSEPANIGLPIPGTELKFAPIGNKLEMRVKGSGVTPGYWRQPDATKNAFDEEGFFKMGDAGRLVNPADVNEGILFDGRVAENFKLLSGTWVNVGLLRVQIIAACVDDVADVVITGHGRDALGALIFPKFGRYQPSCAGREGYLVDPDLQARIGSALQVHNRGAGGSSNRVDRAILAAEPPAVDAGEITDKGYINQRAVLDRRAALVELLYSDEGCSGIIQVER